MPTSTFTCEKGSITNIFEFLKSVDLEDLKIQDPEVRQLRHGITNPSGKAVVFIAVDPLIGNQLEILDPTVYWTFFDLAVMFEKDFKPKEKVKLVCHFPASLVPARL